jgi:ketosteroid isomerase-like protein
VSAAEEALRRIADERSILATLYAYGRALDDGLEADYADCWTPDAVLLRPDRAPLHGREAIVRAFGERRAGVWKHLVLEAEIVLDDDSASVASQYVLLESSRGGVGVRSFGHYRDTLRRCADGKWRLCRRSAENESRRGADAGGG